MSEPFEVELLSHRSLSPSVRELVFARVDRAPLAFLPGQWVNLFIEVGGVEEKRAYSIASAPTAEPGFELAVTRVEGGPVSEALHALPPGAKLWASGPNGLFTRRPEERAPAVFVATGTGVTPLRSMILAALQGGTPAPMTLLFGVRREEDILYRAELEAWVERAPELEVEITLSRPSEGWRGRRGYVQEHLPEVHRALRDRAGGVQPHVYVCGLKRMVGAVRDVARGELGLDRREVHQERYD